MHSLLLALLLAARPFTPKSCSPPRRVDDVQVSPDGKWGFRHGQAKEPGDQQGPTRTSGSCRSRAEPPRQFTRNARSEHAPLSPDGKQLLIVREGQLWLYEAGRRRTGARSPG